MRHSLQKHNVARLRVTLNEYGKLDQEQFAELIGCSVQKLRNIETGRTPLDELLARSIADETGVSIKWLLTGKTKTPLTQFGEKFTKAFFDEVQARRAKRSAQVEGNVLKSDAIESLKRICGILLRANRKRNYHLVAYRIDKAIEELSDEFGEALDFHHGDHYEKLLAYLLPVWQRKEPGLSHFRLERVSRF